MFMEDMDRRRQFLLYQVLSVDAVLKNSTLAKFAYIRQIERDFVRRDKRLKERKVIFSAIFSLHVVFLFVLTP